MTKSTTTKIFTKNIFFDEMPLPASLFSLFSFKISRNPLVSFSRAPFKYSLELEMYRMN